VKLSKVEHGIFSIKYNFLNNENKQNREQAAAIWKQ